MYIQRKHGITCCKSKNMVLLVMHVKARYYDAVIHIHVCPKKKNIPTAWPKNMVYQNVLRYPSKIHCVIIVHVQEHDISKIRGMPICSN